MSKYQMIKSPGGILSPSDEMTAEALTKLKTGELYEVEIKRQRNPAFHRKQFAFFNFCFERWKATNDLQFMDEAAQFDRFRRQLTVLAGYRIEVYNIDGSLRLEAQSISFANMEQEEFEQFAVAVQNVAMRTLFKGADEQTIQRLYSFF